MSTNPYRALPSVDDLAESVTSTLPRPVVVSAARIAIEQARSDISAGGEGDARGLTDRLLRTIERSAGTTVINATGVLLHTNLGRAVWSRSAIEQAAHAAGGYTNIELDLDTGERGRRGGHVTRLLTELTGAEDALVVNNNAAALLLALATTSHGQSVPVARGELIEIGGSYRLPEVMRAGGAQLVEVGTTNRTRLDDYKTALQLHRCGAILKVHPSNYKIEGFHAEASLNDLSALATVETPLLYDLGSGLLDSTPAWVPDWIRSEPAVRQSIDAGADLVLFSGDKLLGGPQAGIVAGRGDLVAAMRSNPLARALRVDGVTYGGLAATLDSYLDGSVADIPFWRQALLTWENLYERCERVAAVTGGTVTADASTVGAGSAPGVAIPTPVLRLDGGQHLFESLLRLDQPVLARRDAGDLVVDLRAVDDRDDQILAQAIRACR